MVSWRLARFLQPHSEVRVGGNWDGHIAGCVSPLHSVTLSQQVEDSGLDPRSVWLQGGVFSLLGRTAPPPRMLYPRLLPQT